MKAKELAAILLENPEYDVFFYLTEGNADCDPTTPDLRVDHETKEILI